MLLTAFLRFVVITNRAGIVLLLAIPEHYFRDHLKIQHKLLTTGYQTIPGLTKDSNMLNFSIGFGWALFHWVVRELS